MKTIIAILVVVWILMVLLAYVLMTQTQSQSIFTVDEELRHMSPLTIGGYIRG